MRTKKYTYGLVSLIMTGMLLCACGQADTEPVQTEGVQKEAIPADTDKAPEEKENETKQNVSNNDSADAVSNDDSADAPIENETADGFMGSFLLSSDRDKIDTTNDYGVLYRVVYKASLEGNELTACGSMDYRNSKDQDPITISSDITHIFKVDDNTVYLKDGENGTETITKEEFAGYLDSRKDSGMYFEVEISGGTVKTALLSAQ